MKSAVLILFGIVIGGFSVWIQSHTTPFARDPSVNFSKIINYSSVKINQRSFSCEDVP
ncbi:MAG: hypothetical protein HOO06_04045 [Bdellovibrionaceae bacterium]|nr:hypothetical protein [Pseudobdellovibrionaceae bacterium]